MKKPADYSAGFFLWSVALVAEGQVSFQEKCPDTRQLSGIIACELGHFSQRGGTFRPHFVLNFSVWCLKASGMQSDLADQVMGNSQTNPSVEIVFRSVLWATQSIGSLLVKGLAMVGLLVTMIVSRGQELGADRYEAELGGRDAFFGTV